MIDKVRRFIKKNNMLKIGDKVVVGVSGGADSVCLLFVLLKLKIEYSLEIHVVHINHGLRGEEADKDEAYVKYLCEEYGIHFNSIKKNVALEAEKQGVSEEEAGRNIRYKAFLEECSRYSCNKIAVAHNENDSTETILFNLFRGSGITGMTGIPAVRDNIIRPLLCVSREEIENFLKENGVNYRTDKTNFEEKYSRNKIRLRVMPYVINEINPKAQKHLMQSSAIFKEIDEYIKKNSMAVYKKIVKNIDGKYILEVNSFLKEDIVIQKGIIRIIFENTVGELKDLEASHVEMVLALMYKGVGKMAVLPYGMAAVRDYETVIIGSSDKMKNEKSISLRIPLSIPGNYFIEDLGLKISFEVKRYEKNIIIPRNGYTKWFDYDKIKNTVFLRTRETGDYLQINKEGKTKKLKNIFIDEKIPKDERNNMPLLAEKNHIIWIIGGRISEAYKVDENTRNILIAVIDGGNSNVR